MSAEWGEEDVEALRRWFSNEGDGGVWEEFDNENARTVARALLASGVVVPARVVEEALSVGDVYRAQREEIQTLADAVGAQRSRAEAAEAETARLRGVIEALRLDLNADADYRVTKGSIGHRLRAALAEPAITTDDRKARALAGEAVECSTYPNLLCACRGGMYPGTPATCSRRREAERS